MCPVVVKNDGSMSVLKRFATKLEAGEVSGLTHSMMPRRPTSFADLSRLCSVFSELELFLWLQKKFPPGNMMEEQAALGRKEHAIQLIGAALAEVCVVQRVIVVFFSTSNFFILYSDGQAQAQSLLYRTRQASPRTMGWN